MESTLYFAAGKLPGHFLICVAVCGECLLSFPDLFWSETAEINKKSLKLEFNWLWKRIMSFESDTEQSDVESIGSRTHICETELGSDEDEEDMYYSDPEGPYIDEPTVDEEWLTEYNRELEEIERRNQELQNRFDRIVEPETW